MKRIFFFMLFISNFIQASENNVFDQKLTPEDIIRKHLYIISMQRPLVSKEYFKKLVFRAYSARPTEEQASLSKDAYCLWQKLQQVENNNELAKSDIVKKHLKEIQTSRGVTYKYLKYVRLSALEALEQGSLGDRALDLDVFMLHEELQKKN